MNELRPGITLKDWSKNGQSYEILDYPLNSQDLVKFKKPSLAKTFKKYELSAVCATAFNG